VWNNNSGVKIFGGASYWWVLNFSGTFVLNHLWNGTVSKIVQNFKITRYNREICNADMKTGYIFEVNPRFSGTLTHEQWCTIDRHIILKVFNWKSDFGAWESRTVLGCRNILLIKMDKIQVCSKCLLTVESHLNEARVCSYCQVETGQIQHWWVKSLRLNGD
jgi:hypothetical protein